MRTATLVCRRDHNGTLGLLVKGVPYEGIDADTDGYIIAHDLVEHVNGPREIGGICDEIEALGVLWYVRGQHGDLRRDARGSSSHAPETHLGSDLSHMLIEVLGGAYIDERVPETRPGDAEQDFEDILKEAARFWAREREYGTGEDAPPGRVELFWQLALAHLRIGYRKGARKYRSSVRANSLFYAIQGAVARAGRGADEGQVFKVRYGFIEGNAYATCEDY